MSITDNLEYRKATKDDLLRIIGMLANDRLGKNREKTGDEIAEGYARFFDMISVDINNDIYVVEHEGSIIGTFQLTFIPSISFGGHWRAHVESVRVATTYRGQGIGTAMFTKICAMAAERNCLMVQLTSNKQRKEAIEFYKRLGFEASHEGFKKYL